MNHTWSTQNSIPFCSIHRRFSPAQIFHSIYGRQLFLMQESMGESLTLYRVIYMHDKPYGCATTNVCTRFGYCAAHWCLIASFASLKMMRRMLDWDFGKVPTQTHVFRKPHEDNAQYLYRNWQTFEIRTHQRWVMAIRLAITASRIRYCLLGLINLIS